MKTRNALRSIAAFGDWDPRVPKGFVGVTAVPGGLAGLTAGGPQRFFLIPAAEHTANMAIEIDRHVEVKDTEKDPDEPEKESDPKPDPEDGATGQALPWSTVIASFNATNQTPEGNGNFGWKKAIAAFNSGARR